MTLKPIADQISLNLYSICDSFSRISLEEVARGSNIPQVYLDIQFLHSPWLSLPLSSARPGKTLLRHLLARSGRTRKPRNRDQNSSRPASRQPSLWGPCQRA